MLSDTFLKKTAISSNFGGKWIDFSEPKVMGILNISEDSFYDGGKYTSKDTALKAAEKHILEGATFIDVGAFSSKPGSEISDPKEEINRILPILKALRQEFPQTIISIDTYHSQVAEATVNEGADLINDISAGEIDKHMLDMVIKLQVPYVLMHMQGVPKTMQVNPAYDKVFQEMVDYFSPKIAYLQAHGAKDLFIDPGFGFGKTLEHNYFLLKNLDLLSKAINLPVLVGLSRKSMVNKVLNIKSLDALNGTNTLNTIALLKGAKILRVHDVKEAVEAIKIAQWVM